MKNKIVVWGTNEQEEKVLIALELQPDTSKVLLHTFPEAIVTDEFVNYMMDKWRNDKNPDPFPEGFHTEERELSVVESLLPDNLRPERTDVIIRAQTEWQFVVLSSKLYRVYEQELQELREKVQALGAYDNGLWDNVKQFWDKVTLQSRDRNLFREHADTLRDNINVLFEDMKALRKKANEEFMGVSKGVYEELNTALTDLEKNIESRGNKFNNVFDELKKLQRRYREARMTNEHRAQFYDRLDKVFKAVKERKFGPGANEGSLVERHGKRLGGLMDAVRRMELSVKRDEEDLAFEQKKVARTEGQLEAQIRGAKIKMIEERLASKREKLNEILRTRDQVEQQIKTAEEKETQRIEKEAERARLLEAKEKARQEIAEQTKKRKAEGLADAPQTAENEKDTHADAIGATEDAPPAEAPAEPKPDSLLQAIGNIIGDVIDETLVAAEAVAIVVSEKAEEAFHHIVDQAELVAEAIENVQADEEDAKAAASARPPKAKKAEAKPSKETVVAPVEDLVAEETTAVPVEESAAEAAPATPEATVVEEPVAPTEPEIQPAPVEDIAANEVYVPTEPDVTVMPIPTEEPLPATPDAPGEISDDKKDA
ncbi:MAG: hypothetical protein ACOYPR_04945 [Saprospiraceae bacterium]